MNAEGDISAEISDHRPISVSHRSEAASPELRQYRPSSLVVTRERSPLPTKRSTEHGALQEEVPPSSHHVTVADVDFELRDRRNLARTPTVRFVASPPSVTLRGGLFCLPHTDSDKSRLIIASAVE